MPAAVTALVIVCFNGANFTVEKITAHAVAKMNQYGIGLYLHFGRMQAMLLEFRIIGDEVVVIEVEYRRRQSGTLAKITLWPVKPELVI